MRYLALFAMIILVLSADAFAQQRNTHTVAQGETLYSISKTLNVTVAELQAWNDLSSNDISIGQNLIYYTDEEQSTPDSSSSSGPSLVNITTPQENIFYTVKSGDNLTVIARAHNMTVSELKELNNLESDLLRIGQRLSVRKPVNSVAPSASEFSGESAPQGSFAVYTIQSGEATAILLDKFRMTAQELQELNPDVNISALEQGQTITVLLPPSRNFDNPYLAKANLQDLGTVSVNSYSETDAGNTTTSGELYNPDELTAAHSNIALGSIIFIENSVTKQGIYVRVNDRVTGAGLKLSNKAYRILGLTGNGNPTVTIYTGS